MTPVSTFLAFGSGFVRDPDDHTGSYYHDKIPGRQWVMGLSLLIPTMTAAAASASIFARPRALTRIVIGSIVLLLAVVGIWLSWVVGIDDLEKFERFANRFP